jgi:type IV pilus assembly protein PilN
VATKLNEAGRLWLLDLNQQGGSLTLKGVGLDNRTIADFMNSLKSSDYLSSVNLRDSSLKKFGGRSLKTFSLTCSVSPPKPVETKKKAPGQQKK